ncbi:MAG: response regulator transcription factor [Planctomycetaceae bacterium]
MVQSHHIGILLSDPTVGARLESVIQDCTQYRSAFLHTTADLLDDSCVAKCAFVDMALGRNAVQGILQRLRELRRPIAIILLGSFVPPNEAIRLSRLGVSGIVTDVTSRSQLRANIHEAFEVHAARKAWLQRRNSARALIDRLSERQRHVLDLVVRGMPNKQIAGALYLSTRTVEKHRAQLYQKTGLLNAIQLLRLHDDAHQPDSDMFGGNALQTIRECEHQQPRTEPLYRTSRQTWQEDVISG